MFLVLCPQIKESFGKFIHAYYTSKQASMHMHIAVSVAMGVAFVFNLMPWWGRGGPGHVIVTCVHLA